VLSNPSLDVVQRSLAVYAVVVEDILGGLGEPDSANLGRDCCRSLKTDQGSAVLLTEN
jgi:hypothetical protein